MNEITTSWAWPWWSIIVTVNMIQLVFCIYYVISKRNKSSVKLDGYGKAMIILGLIFTVVGAYRSIFVSRYLTQLAWFDTIANSSLIIRSMAFFAEMSFALQFALFLLRFEKDIPAKDSRGVLYRLYSKGPYIIVICLFIAQFFAYGGLIFKSRLAFAIEETLWSIGFLSILPLSMSQLIRIWHQRQAELKVMRIASAVVALWCTIYCIYGLAFHLPLEYWSSAIDQIQTNIPQLKSGFSAFKDALLDVNVTHNYQDWGFGFIFWHSSYFTICVWISLFLMRAPRRQPKA
jgi:hypothetical protein